MTSTMNHLTEDQIDDQLIGDLAPEATAHLAGCAECKARVAEVEAPIASFKTVSLAWSERRSATMSPAPIAHTAPRWQRRLAWGSAVTAALAVGIAIPVVRHNSDSATVQSASVSTRPVITEEQIIAHDNQMLQSIDRELNSGVTSPESLGLQPASQQRTRVRASALQN